MKNPILSTTHSSFFSVLVVATMLSGCAPGAWNEQSDADKFFDVIENACPQRIGGFEISTMENHNASFLDLTSQLYYGKITEARYREMITAFSDSTAETNQAVDCIIAHLPKAPPPTPSELPGMANKPGNDAPPPPGM